MFRIAFVCTGNRCRSPVGASSLASIVRHLPVEVTSAGVLDLAGQSSPGETVEAARGLGLDLGNHRSVHISSAHLGEADLVIGFERQHVAAAVVDGGARVERTFTLVELLAIIQDIDVPDGLPPIERAAAIVGRAHALRRATSRFVPGEETPDPIGKPLEAHRQMAATIAAMCGQLAEALFGNDAADRNAAAY